MFIIISSDCYKTFGKLVMIWSIRSNSLTTYVCTIKELSNSRRFKIIGWTFELTDSVVKTFYKVSTA